MAVQNFTAVTTEAPNSGSGSSGSASTGSDSSKSSTNVGAIAGGVVGGVVVLALIAGVAVFLIRRRKNKALPESDTNRGHYPQEMPGEAHAKHEMADNSNLAQTANKKYGNPNPLQPQYEMPTNELRHEMA
jgi:hypothetical protein